MTGDQLLPACTHSIRPIVAIMITTDPTPELALHFMRLGAYGYLRKPFDPAYLVDLCARALRERTLLRVEELLEERTRALRTSEAQFRLLFDSIPDAVLVHDTDGTILAMNEVGRTGSNGPLRLWSGNLSARCSHHITPFPWAYYNLRPPTAARPPCARCPWRTQDVV